MNVRKLVWVLPMILLGTGTALAQDPVKVDSAHYKVILDNPSVRILRITYPKGSKSVMHKHPDAIVIPLSTSKMHFAMADGTSQDLDLARGSASYTPAVTHDPSNIGTATMDAILVEFKGAAPGTAAIPTSRPNMTLKTLTQGPYGTAVMATADPAFHEPAGSKHDYDQVVIAMNDSKMSLAVDGQPAKTSWKRGDVAFIPRGTAHESKNGGSASSDMVIVVIK